MSYIIDVNNPFMAPKEEILREVSEVLASNTLTNFGPKHDQLKRNLGAFLGTDSPVLFSNGHSALECAISAFQFDEGSEIITTPYTFTSTINAIIRCGMVPVFCDIREDDFTIDADKIAELITPKTVAILPVHIFGFPCDIDKIEGVAKEYDLKVIYDAAQAFGSKYKGKSVSHYGDVAIFSFHATKIFNTLEGGAAFTKDPDIVDRMLALSNFGIKNKKEIVYWGGNFKMSEMHAAAGICNLRHIDDEIVRRKSVHHFYERHLGKREGIFFPVHDSESQVNYSYMPVLFDGRYSRDEIAISLDRNGVNCRKSYYPLPFRGECFGKWRFAEKFRVPVAEYVSSHILTLPMYGSLSGVQVNMIAEIIIKTAE